MELSSPGVILRNGADSKQLKHVRQIQSSTGAFAAIMDDGTVVTWGNAVFGGDSSTVQGQLKTVQQIQSCKVAFAGHSHQWICRDVGSLLGCW